MAGGNVVGSLRVLLGLDAADFVQGLTKADRQAQQFAERMRTEIGGAVKSVAGVLGGLAIGQQVLESTKAIIAEASALNDLADATGSSVESLSRLNNQARIAGTDLGTLQGYVSKLSVSMTKTDDESKDAARALAFLGISTQDPAEAFQQIAVKLSGYQDGLGKVALATALFGKQGAQVLPLLKDIAEMQDVAATTTGRQAQEAENLEKAYRRLGVEATTFKNIILSDVVPAINGVIERFRLAREMGEGFGGGLKAATLDMDLIVALTTRQAQAVEDARKKLAFVDRSPAFSSNTKQHDRLMQQLSEQEKQYRLLTALRDQFVTKGVAALGFVGDSKDQRLGNSAASVSKIVADFRGGGGGSGTAARERQSDAERYIEALQRQLDGTLDLTAAEQVLRDVQTGRFKEASHGQIDIALGYAQQIDANKAAKKAADEQIAAIKDFDRATEDYLESIRKSTDAATRERDGILQGNEAIREQIIAITGGQAALDAYNAAKRESIALAKEAIANSLSPAFAEEAKALREAAAGLRAMNAATGELRIAEQIKAQSDAIKSLKGEAFDIAGRAVSDLAVNGAKASSVLKNLERDLVSFLMNQALTGIKNNLMGQPSNDLFSLLIGKLPSIIGLFGGGGGLPTSSSGGGFGEHFALGGTPSAGFAVVGENGPEIVQFSGRERVYSNAQSKAMLGGSVTVQQHFNVTGQVDSRTGRQMAREAGGAVAMARTRG